MKFKEVREKSPLVVNLTNFVTVNDVANILSQIGASPIMSKDIREATDLMNIVEAVGGALVVNIGTIDEVQEKQILEFVRVANEKNITIVLDPVGAGASKIRTDICLKLLNEYKVNFVRGNFSEINALLGSDDLVKGVDSSEITNKDAASIFANKFDTAVLISGKDDYIAVGDQSKEFIGLGSDYLPKISGTGCMLTSILGAYSASVECRMEAMEKALLHVTTAASNAEANSTSTMEFKNNFFTEMEKLTHE